MSTCNGYCFLLACNQSENLRTFLYHKSVFSCILQNTIVISYCRSINHHVDMSACYVRRVIFVLYVHTLGNQLLGKGSRSSVIAENIITYLLQISRYGTHAYSSYTDKVICFRFHLLSFFFTSLSISSTILLSASLIPI